MQILKYKSHTFEVRENFLGIGAKISALYIKLIDEQMLATYVAVGLPGWSKYLAAINELKVYATDLAEQKKKLEKAKNNKKLQAIVNKGQANYDEAAKQLDDPEVIRAYEHYSRAKGSATAAFKMDYFKEVTNILIIGDLSVIDWNKYDADLEQLQEDVFKVFFSISRKMSKFQPIQ